MISKLKKIWSPDDSSYIDNRSEIFDYDEYGNEVYDELIIVDLTTNILKPFGRKERIYNDNNQLEEYRYFNWDEERNDW